VPRPARPSRAVRDVVFVDGVRTPFGKAGPKGLYAQTRADDLMVRCIRELLRRNPTLPPERVDDVADGRLRDDHLDEATPGRGVQVLALSLEVDLGHQLSHGLRLPGS